MFCLDRILVPVDFSERSVCAARYARALASRQGSQVVLLHALPLPHYEGGWGMGGEVFAERRRTVEAELAGLVEKELGGIKAGYVVVDGDASLAVIDYVASRQTDLIVMPTHGYGPFRQFFLGSTATRVLERVQVPVLTGAHMGADKEIAIDNVVCAVDLSEESAGVLEWASRVGRLFGARLFVVHVLGALGAPHAEEYFEAPLEAGHETLSKLEALKAHVGVEAVPIVAGGEPVAAIRQQAGELSAGLIVIGRGAVREGLKGRLRAHSLRLIREAHCPVLSV